MVAVNPYRWYQELYTEENRSYYSDKLVWEQSTEDPRAAIEPHVYEISALAYKGLIMGDNQSILVSGESGAGKTETVKICLSHIASVQQRKARPGDFNDREMNQVVQRVVQSNPLLEAFGNAKTCRNDNSSRFGKYLQLQFDKNGATNGSANPSAKGRLVGSRCDVYLLEKSRVVGHDLRGERNFHIFYELLAAPDSEKCQFWEGLRGATNESFKYVGPTDTDAIEGVKDANRFKQTIEALELVGIEGECLITLMKAICIVLQLGNLGFDAKSGDSDKSTVVTRAELRILSDLMGIPVNTLEASLTERTFKTVKETHKVPLNATAAKEACDALAKDAYQKTFLWLVSAINKATSTSTDESENLKTIGLVDIFGFEVFTVNHFEQLCINYANEKLQQKVTEDLFRSVQEEYRSEGIPIAEFWCNDNSDVLALIEGPTGLLNLLNEECIRPKGNDFAFVQKAIKTCRTSASLIVHKTDRLSFGIKHYAGEVMYDAESFVTKNLDMFPTDLQTCAEACTNSIIRKKTPRTGSFREQADRQLSNIVAPTVWTKYRSQLSLLMANLRKTKSRYIRCIKPNSKKQSLIMEHRLVVDQLRSAGVVAGIITSRSIFPSRLPNSVVLARYANMYHRKRFPPKGQPLMTMQENQMEDCKALLNSALKEKETIKDGLVIKAFAVGKTKTYFRTGALELLESGRMNDLDNQAMAIQKAARGWLVRRPDKSSNQDKQQELINANSVAKLEAQLTRTKTELTLDYQKRQKRHLSEIEELEQELKIAESELKARKRTEKARRAQAEMKEQFRAEHDRTISSGLAYQAEQAEKIKEVTTMIKMLKKENKKLQQANDLVNRKVNDISNLNKSIDQMSSTLADSVNLVEKEVADAMEEYISLLDELGEAKSIHKDLTKKVMSQQENYMDLAEGRLQIQKSLAVILVAIQERIADDTSLVEEVFAIAHNTEKEAVSIMSELNTEQQQHGQPCMESSQPSLAYSDISDMSEFSHHSDF